MKYESINGWFVVRYEPPKSSFKVDENIQNKQLIVEILDYSAFFQSGVEILLPIADGSEKCLVLGRDLLKIEGEENLYLIRGENILSIINE